MSAIINVRCKCGAITNVQFFDPIGAGDRIDIADTQKLRYIERDYANATSEQQTEIRKRKLRRQSCTNVIFPNPLKVKFIETTEDYGRIVKITAVLQNPSTATYATSLFNRYGEDVAIQTRKAAIGTTSNALYGDIRKAIWEAKYKLRGQPLDHLAVFELLEEIEKSIPTHEKFLEE